MSNPLLWSPLVRCTRHTDGSCYLSNCVCPSVRLVAKTFSNNYILKGFSEYTDRSEPPKKYLTQSHELDTQGGGSMSGSGTESYSFNIDGETEISRSYTYTFGRGNCRFNCSPTTVDQDYPYTGLPVGSCPGTDGLSCTGPIGSLPHTITTSRTNIKYECDNCSGGSYGTSSFSLSDEDTEAAAEARAGAPFEGVARYANRQSSIYSNRSSTGFNWRKQEVKFCFVATNLCPGVQYRGELPAYSREAIEGTNSDYEGAPSIKFSFTANDIFHIEGGWLSGITGADFIENNYSLDATDYGKPSGTDVITPTENLPTIKGIEILIGAYSLIDNKVLYIEKV